MVAVISSGRSVQRIFNYNEQKESQGLARCLYAGNYPMDVGALSRSQRLNRLLNQAEMNSNVKRSAVHISLNFAPGEELPDEKMRQIGEEYMQGIGFGEQPFLIYRHEDAGHPHLHIVSIKIRADGSRIDTQHIGKNQSELVRKELEERHGLVKAAGRGQKISRPLPLTAEAVAYGKTPLKRAMSRVLNQVLSGYVFTSLAELNAVLGTYGMRAEPGKDGSRLARFRGLYYLALDADGKAAGVPLKASLFATNPGLKFLEKRFLTNLSVAKKLKWPLRQKLDDAWRQRPVSPDELRKELRSMDIEVVIRRGKLGQIYGLTYVDHGLKCVFNGSALGKAYSAKATLERCGRNAVFRQKVISNEPFKEADFSGGNLASTRQSAHLFESEWQPESLPFELKASRKKRRKRKIDQL